MPWLVQFTFVVSDHMTRATGSEKTSIYMYVTFDCMSQVSDHMSTVTSIGRRRYASNVFYDWPKRFPQKKSHPVSKVHEAYMGPTCGRQDASGPHVGPMNLAIRAGEWPCLSDGEGTSDIRIFLHFSAYGTAVGLSQYFLKRAPIPHNGMELQWNTDVYLWKGITHSVG